MFTGERPGPRRAGAGAAADQRAARQSGAFDANSSTFYSAMSNIDFEIGAGQSRRPSPCASTSRSTASCSHMDFHIGSGLAGIYQVGNEGEDLRFYGGRYGILTEKTSPAWQFTLIDSEFDGPARRGDPRARGRPDAGQRHHPQRAGRHRDRPRLSDRCGSRTSASRTSRRPAW